MTTHDNRASGLGQKLMTEGVKGEQNCLFLRDIIYEWSQIGRQANLNFLGREIVLKSVLFTNCHGLKIMRAENITRKCLP